MWAITAKQALSRVTQQPTVMGFPTSMLFKWRTPEMHTKKGNICRNQEIQPVHNGSINNLFFWTRQVLLKAIRKEWFISDVMFKSTPVCFNRYRVLWWRESRMKPWKPWSFFLKSKLIYYTLILTNKRNQNTLCLSAQAARHKETNSPPLYTPSIHGWCLIAGRAMNLPGLITHTFSSQHSQPDRCPCEKQEGKPGDEHQERRPVGALTQLSTAWHDREQSPGARPLGSSHPQGTWAWSCCVLRRGWQGSGCLVGQQSWWLHSFPIPHGQHHLLMQMPELGKMHAEF